MPTEYFEQRERALLGPRYEQLYAAPQEAAERGVTVSALRAMPEQFAQKADFPLEVSPFCKAAFVVHAPEFKPGRHPYHHAGVFYSQEPSASSAAPLLGVQPGMRVLDLCAAPGGKSSQLAAALQGRGVLVSNEYVAARAEILKSNLERMGVPNAVVLNETPARIAEALPEFFDRVLVDAPCSGEGMFRKEPVARQQHCEALVKQCAELGAQILDCAAAALAPGGQLVYSTCTFAPVENEGSISWILEQCPEMELIPIEGYEGFSEGNPAWGDGREELRCCVRIWPHKMKGEGHFLALLKKSEDAPETRIRLEPPTRMDKKNKAVLEEFFRDCQWKPDWERVQIKGEKVGFGGSITAKEMNLFEVLGKDNEVIWHWEQGPDARIRAKKESTVYILSANAAAETGQIINIDGTGNRLSESLFGPKRVYYVIGKNKIAPDLSSAMDRARNIACPKNAARFNKKTPCVVSDDKKCYDCNSPERICNAILILERPCTGMEVEMVFINEDLGY